MWLELTMREQDWKHSQQPNIYQAIDYDKLIAA